MLFLSKQSNFCCFRCVISTLTKMLNFYGSFFTLINIRTEDISRFKEKRLKSVTSGNLCKIRKNLRGHYNNSPIRTVICHEI